MFRSIGANLSIVIPGPPISGLPEIGPSIVPSRLQPTWVRQRGSPESITTALDYRFRARATQVGYSRLGRYLVPISGKPEIGGAPRNDDREIPCKRRGH